MPRGEPTLKYDYAAIRHWYMMGVTWEEIAHKLGLPRRRWQSPYNFSRRIARKRGEQWPWVRPPESKHKMRSEASRKQHRSVKPMIIMDMVTEYCEDNDMSLSDFCQRKLGITDHRYVSRFYGYRSGRIPWMSGATAARLLTAIDEPVPDRVLGRGRHRRVQRRRTQAA
jgi:hypothetical protein